MIVQPKRFLLQKQEKQGNKLNIFNKEGLEDDIKNEETEEDEKEEN